MTAILVLALMVPQSVLVAQGEANWWYFGQNAGINFNTSPPTPVTGSLVTQEGCSSVSDAQGNLLMYTDGITVYNRNHVVMANGTGLLGNFSTAQSAVIVKQPGSSTMYYIFTLGVFSGALNYSVVDMSLAAGNGSVVTKNVFLANNLVEQLAAVYHANGQDVWVVVHNSGSNTIFKAFLLSSSGVNTSPVLSTVGTPGSQQGLTYLRFSPDGKFAATSMYPGVELFDFNSSTGVLSNARFFPTADDTYGLEFSPDGTKLYASSFWDNVIYQWSICAGTQTAIAATTHTIYSNDPYAMQLGPDGKIYVAHYMKGFLGVINSPNAAGNSCNFVDNGFPLLTSTFSRCGLPNYVNSFLLPSPPAPSVTVATPSNGLACMTASFSAPSPSAITLPGCSASSIPLTGILWNFGDPASGSSNTSTAQSDTHLYTATGHYTVTLIFYFGGGAMTDTARKTIFIDYPCISVTSKSITCATPGTATVSVSGIPGQVGYHWLPSGQTSSVATGLVPGTYTVTIKNLVTNATYTDQVIFVSPIPLTGDLLHQDTLLCFGASDGTASIVNINGGSSQQNFVWSNVTATLSGKQLQTLSAGNWSVTVTDGVTGCSFTHSFSLFEPPPLIVTASASPTLVCVGAPITLSVNASGGKSPSSFLFTWPDGTTGPLCVTTETVPGQYSYSVHCKNTYGCEAVAAVAVEFLPQHQLSVNNTTVCYQSAGQLTVTGAHSYTWSNHTSDSVLTDTPLSTTIYTVRGSWLGCVSDATASIEVLPVPNAQAIASSSAVCLNSEVTLKAKGGTTYSWFGPSNARYYGDEVKVVCTPGSAGQYTLIAFNELGCPGHTMTAFLLLEPPSGRLDGRLSGCAPLCETFSFIPSHQNVICTWTLPKGKAPGQSFSYCFTEPGQHNVIGHLKSTETGCTDTRTFAINVLPQPVADFSWTPERPVAGIDEALFETSGSLQTDHALSWFMWENEGFKSQRSSSSATFEHPGLYPVALVVTNGSGCSDTLVRTVEVVGDYHFYVPNAFTPNGDGRNDVFSAEVSQAKNFRMEVYSRWGELIFSTNDTTTGWDGSFRGAGCKQDTYVWRAVVTSTQGDVKKYEGTVSLLR